MQLEIFYVATDLLIYANSNANLHKWLGFWLLFCAFHV